MQQIVVGEIDFIAAPSQVVTEEASERALGGDVRGHRADGYVICRDRRERAVVCGIVGIEKPIMVEIIAAGRFALVIESAQQRETLSQIVEVVSAAAGNGAEFALTDQSLSEIR